MKTTIGLLVMIVLATLIVGCTAQTVPTNNEPVKSVLDLQADAVTTPEAPAEIPAVTGDAQATCNAYFQGLMPGSDSDALKIYVDGSVFDQKTNAAISNLKVIAYCDGTEVASANTDMNGKFHVVTDQDACPQGSSAWLKVDYEGASCISMDVVVPSTPSLNSFDVEGSSDSPKNTEVAKFSAPVGVPEFSTLTLLGAVVLAGLGLAYLRRE